MKKLSLIAFLIIIYGCSKKQTPTPITITGKWYVSKSAITDYNNGIVVSQQDTTLNHSSYVIFNQDQTGSSFYDGQTSSFKYSLSGNVLTVTSPPYNPTDPNEANISVSTVKVLTSSILELYQEDDGSTNNGTPSTYKEIIDQTYVR